MKKKSLVLLTSILALAGLTGCNPNDNGHSFANDMKVTGVSLDVSYQKLEVGESLVLTPTISYKDDVEVECYQEWRSSNNKIATVDNGVVLALKAGRAAITFLAGYKSASCSIEVPDNNVIVVPSDTGETGEQTNPGGFTITLNTSSVTLTTGDTYQLRATVSEEASVTWTSTAESVASVTQSGLVTAHSEGVATIHATSNGKSVSCEVTVSNQQEELPHDDDMTVHIYFFLDYNNADEEDTTGTKLLAHFWWYDDKPIAESGKVPATPAKAPTPDFPYFAGWSTHPIIDSKSGLLDLATYKVSDDGSRSFLYIYGIWTDVQGGMSI